MADKINIEDNSGDKDFFTIVPNYILNHSTAVDQALYLQLKRLSGDGKKNYCYPSFRYLQKHLHIGKKSLKKSLEYLIGHKWIENLGKRQMHTGGGMQWINAYKINDIWNLNAEHYRGGSESTPPEKVDLELLKVGSKELEEGSVVLSKQKRNQELIKKQSVCLILKNWNNNQSSPLIGFKPENIINKHGSERIEALVKIYGQKNGGFYQFLQSLKEIK